MVILLAIVLTVFGWWFATGIILWINQQPAATHRWSMAAATVMLALALLQIPGTASELTLGASVAAFGQALVVWGWLEMGYLMGFITGPSNRPCPPNATGWNRFSLALKTSLYHELSVVALVLLVVAISAGEPNQVAAQTCTVLWLMRWSAKLNLFLGVTNFHSEWLPASQRHLVSYMRTRRINPLFPVSVTVGTAFSAWFMVGLLDATTPGEQAACAIVAWLLALGVLEHWFLVLPVQDSRLWQWAMPGQERTSGERALGAGRV